MLPMQRRFTKVRLPRNIETNSMWSCAWALGGWVRGWHHCPPSPQNCAYWASGRMCGRVTQRSYPLRVPQIRTCPTQASGSPELQFCYALDAECTRRVLGSG
jgi:hypothetical protein